MRLPFLLVSVASALLVLYLAGSSLWRLYRGPQPLPPEEAIDVAEVIAAIKRELRTVRTAEDQKKDSFPPLRAVKLELKVVAREEVGAALSFAVPSAPAEAKLSNKETNSRTQKIELTLTPPAPTLTQGTFAVSNLGLAQAILALRADLQRGVSEPPLLEATEVKLTVEFAVKRTSEKEAGLSFEVFKNTEGTKSEREDANKIVLEFGKPKPVENKW